MSGKFILLIGVYKSIFVLSDLYDHIYFYRFVKKNLELDFLEILFLELLIL